MAIKPRKEPTMATIQTTPLFSKNIQDAKAFKTYEACSEAKAAQSRGGLVPDNDSWMVRMTQNANGDYIIARTICLSTGAVDYLV